MQTQEKYEHARKLVNEGQGIREASESAGITPSIYYYYKHKNSKGKPKAKLQAKVKIKRKTKSKVIVSDLPEVPAIQPGKCFLIVGDSQALANFIRVYA